MSWLKEKTNLTIARYDRIQALKRAEKDSMDLDFVKAMPMDSRARCLDLLEKSNAQLRQDIFALVQGGFKRGGYFVEFGATNGIDLNNTNLLEKEFGWKGILAEPARGWHSDLKRDRKDAAIETRCVWRASGETLSFTEAPRGENSGVSQYIPKSRKIRGSTYDVETISLLDMLEKHAAPEFIDYMSVDTEGSEFEILDAMDFSKYRFRVLTIEHNHMPQREDIFNKLTHHGYRRVLTEISRWDDWYVLD